MGLFGTFSRVLPGGGEVAVRLPLWWSLLGDAGARGAAGVRDVTAVAGEGCAFSCFDGS